jgi:hypothetical protein
MSSQLRLKPFVLKHGAPFGSAAGSVVAIDSGFRKYLGQIAPGSAAALMLLIHRSASSSMLAKPHLLD